MRLHLVKADRQDIISSASYPNQRVTTFPGVSSPIWTHSGLWKSAQQIKDSIENNGTDLSEHHLTLNRNITQSSGPIS